MSKRPMESFPPARQHQPDEGYSEAPLNPTVHHDLLSALATLKSPSDLPSWLITNASLLPLELKTELTMALLDDLPTSVIADIVEHLNPRLYIDFVRYLPAEICLKILSYLDPISLVCVTQTCRAWYDLALDRKLWERLYYLEGWKAIKSEIETSETRVNNGINTSIGHLSRMQSAEAAHPSKIHAILNNDEDMEMTDGDRSPGVYGGVPGASIFGGPSSSITPSRQGLIPMGDMDIDTAAAPRSSIIDEGLATRSDSRGKRKEPGGEPEKIPTPSLPTNSGLTRSTLWTWDIGSSRYRINWKYLYNMRRRLETNWELGKYTSFQLPHPAYPEEGHQECIYTLQFDANYLVSGSRDQTMRIWNTHTRRLVRPPLAGHTGSVLCLQFDADPEEDLLVSGSSDSNVFIWKFSTGELIQRLHKAHRESVLNVRFDKRILVTSSKDKTIKIFNRRPLRHGDLGYGGVVSSVAQNLRRYGYEPDLAMELPVKPPFTMIGRLDGHSAAVNAIQVRDRTIVSVSGDRHIKVWNWPDQVCLQTIPAHDKGIACVEFDGRRIVSGSSDYEVCIFDAPTGLKVAQLRGHAHLVRTVQAGFGDLPYSKYEDEAEAKAVDAEYFRAVKAGEIEHDPERRQRRNRRANAGSSRPEDVQAFGAKVPPGGGGGRKYGRIVSGSYDQSIIIWRRDKEGVWKPAHHLRQEEAAAAAHRNMVPSPRTIFGQLTREASTTPRPLPRPASPGESSQQLPGINELLSGAPVPATASQHFFHGYPRTAAAYQAIIDSVVPLGNAGLRQALARYPYMLAHHTYLQARIEQEPSPFVRSQMRQSVTDALVTFQSGQGARQLMPGHLTIANLTAGSSNASTGQSGVGASWSGAAVASSSGGPSSGASQSNAPNVPSLNSAGSVASTMPTPAAVSNTPMHGLPPSSQQHAQQQPPPQNGTHHPHMAGAENTPARVFKLQFDARKIVCCSQAPVIVGWDFCNKDPELEEASRFFATVD